LEIVIGADKGGFALKEAIAQHLRDSGFAVEDVGTLSLERPVDYVSAAQRAARLISEGCAERAILVCGTGMGMSITANKIKGVRAAVVESIYAAEYARKINNANVLCLGGFIVGSAMACEIVDVFLKTGYLDGFPQWRIDYLSKQMGKLEQLETESFRTAQ
jgi:ribose 5-phosphate isomerase B